MLARRIWQQEMEVAVVIPRAGFENAQFPCILARGVSCDNLARYPGLGEVGLVCHCGKTLEESRSWGYGWKDIESKRQ
jgi:hypothetical protein